MENGRDIPTKAPTRRFARMEGWAIGLILLLALPQVVVLVSVELFLLFQSPAFLDWLGASRAWGLYFYSLTCSWGLWLVWVGFRAALLRGQGLSWGRFLCWTAVPLGLAAFWGSTILLRAYLH